MEKSDSKVLIRSAKVTDVENLCMWWADGVIMAHAGFPNGLKTDADQLREKILATRETTLPESEILIIEYKGKKIGEMSYNLVHLNTFEVGIKICDFNYHNMGIGNIAMKLMMDYLFNERLAKTIVLDTNLKNTGAQRFYERIGFDKIEVKYNNWENQLGEPQSTVYYKLDKEKYSTL